MASASTQPLHSAALASTQGQRTMSKAYFLRIIRLLRRRRMPWYLPQRRARGMVRWTRFTNGIMMQKMHEPWFQRHRHLEWVLQFAVLTDEDRARRKGDCRTIRDRIAARVCALILPGEETPHDVRDAMTLIHDGPWDPGDFGRFVKPVRRRIQREWWDGHRPLPMSVNLHTAARRLRCIRIARQNGQWPPP